MTISQQDQTGSNRGSNPVTPHHQVPQGPGETWGGQDLKRALNAASAWLSRHIDALNALNVFPVPDGDTGTNMALTMQAATTAVAQSPSHSCAEIASGVSHGALMGARGNSGVILSQIWRGFAEGIAGKDRISALDFGEGLVTATAMAYRAVLKPVEGTILTVVRETGVRAKEAAEQENSFRYMLEAAAKEARASVARTPDLLEKHREAGVVDAGGQGLFVILDGLRRFAAGEDLESVEVEGAAAVATSATGHAQVEHGEYGYCTNFLIVGGGWQFDSVRSHLAGMGESAVIVGDDKVVKVHIHTESPGSVLEYAEKLGSLRQISITDMQEQHDEFIEIHGSKPLNGDAHGLAGNAASRAQQQIGKIAVLVVASGAGMAETFRSMGATAIIEGGQTMNPSTEQLLKVIESVSQDEVILLPNNGNIVLAARQSQGLSKKRVAVVPTETVPQGMSAIIALNVDASLEENAKAMERAAEGVETGEITRAVRDAKVNGLDVKEGNVIGLHNNSLVVTGSDRDEVTWDLLERMGAAGRELITVYWGNDLTSEQAEKFHQQVQERYPEADVELVNGGQPLYDYIISAE